MLTKKNRLLNAPGIYDNYTSVEVIYELLENKKQNIILTGAPGAGKSYLLKELLGKYNEGEVLKLGSTGLASDSIDGTTIHNALMYSSNQYNKLKESSIVDDSIKAHIKKKISTKKIKLVVIDEGFSVNHELIYLLDTALREVMSVDKINGGIPTLITGDPLQIAPVSGQIATVLDSVTQNYMSIYLTGQHRYKDAKLIQIIKDAQRNGKVSENLIKQINTADKHLYVREDVLQIVATNKERGELNMELYSNKPGAIHFHVETIDTTSTKIHQEVYFEGQEIILKNNIYTNGTALQYNGEKAVIEKIEEIIYPNPDKKTYKITYKKLKDNSVSYNEIDLEKKEVNDINDWFATQDVSVKTQTSFKIPFIGSNVITSHLLQGQTISDKNIAVHLEKGAKSSVFVAISRVAKLNQIVYIDYSEKSLSINPKQFNAYVYLKEKSFGIMTRQGANFPVSIEEHTQTFYDKDKEVKTGKTALKGLKKYSSPFFNKIAEIMGTPFIGNQSELKYFASDLKTEKNDSVTSNDMYFVTYFRQDTKKSDKLVKNTFEDATATRTFTSFMTSKYYMGKLSNSAENAVSANAVIIDADDYISQRTDKDVDSLNDDEIKKYAEEFVETLNNIAKEHPFLMPNVITTSSKEGMHFKYAIPGILIDNTIRGGLNKKDGAKNEILSQNKGYLLIDTYKKALEALIWKKMNFKASQNHQGYNQQTTVNGSLTKAGQKELDRLGKQYKDFPGSRTASILIKKDGVTYQDMLDTVALANIELFEEDTESLIEKEKLAHSDYEALVRDAIIVKYNEEKEVNNLLISKSANHPNIGKNAIHKEIEALKNVEIIRSKLVAKRYIKDLVAKMHLVSIPKEDIIATVSAILNSWIHTMQNKDNYFTTAKQFIDFRKSILTEKTINNKKYDLNTSAKSVKNNANFNLTKQEKNALNLLNGSTIGQSSRNGKLAYTKSGRERAFIVATFTKEAEKVFNKDYNNFTKKEKDDLRIVLSNIDILTERAKARRADFDKEISIALNMYNIFTTTGADLFKAEDFKQVRKIIKNTTTMRSRVKKIIASPANNSAKKLFNAVKREFKTDREKEMLHRLIVSNKVIYQIFSSHSIAHQYKFNDFLKLLTDSLPVKAVLPNRNIKPYTFVDVDKLKSKGSLLQTKEYISLLNDIRYNAHTREDSLTGWSNADFKLYKEAQKEFRNILKTAESKLKNKAQSNILKAIIKNTEKSLEIVSSQYEKVKVKREKTVKEFKKSKSKNSGKTSNNATAIKHAQKSILIGIGAKEIKEIAKIDKSIFGQLGVTLPGSTPKVSDVCLSTQKNRVIIPKTGKKLRFL